MTAGELTEQIVNHEGPILVPVQVLEGTEYLVVDRADLIKWLGELEADEDAPLEPVDPRDWHPDSTPALYRGPQHLILDTPED